MLLVLTWNGCCGSLYHTHTQCLCLLCLFLKTTSKHTSMQEITTTVNRYWTGSFFSPNLSYYHALLGKIHFMKTNKCNWNCDVSHSLIRYVWLIWISQQWEPQTLNLNAIQYNVNNKAPFGIWFSESRSWNGIQFCVSIECVEFNWIP